MAKRLMILTAVLAIGLSYLYAVFCLVVLLIVLAFDIAVLGIGFRFGFVRIPLRWLNRHVQLIGLFFRSLWVSKPVEFRSPISRTDAPGLFEVIDQLADRMEVAPPTEIILEMNASAWVLLDRGGRASKATRLGLGYDLIAGLEVDELQSVLAHELAHAKLVRRQLKQRLNGGVARAARLAQGLSANRFNADGGNDPLVYSLFIPADRCARLAAFSVARYSRQDEFEADAEAARLCGGGPLRSALTKLRGISERTARITWSERVAQLQRPDGFAAWLMSEISTNVGGEVGSGEEIKSRFSTHPNLVDRLAALPPGERSAGAATPALSFFAHPDAMAQQLVREIRRVALIQEEKDSKQLAKRRRRLARTGPSRGVQKISIVLATIAVVILITLVTGFVLPTFLIGVGMLLVAFFLPRWIKPNDPLTLPVPPYQVIMAGRIGPTRRAAIAATEKVLIEEFTRIGATSGASGYGAEAGKAIGSADYLRAHVASRRWMEAKPKSLEAKQIFAIACAALQNHAQAVTFQNAVRAKAGLVSLDAMWGASWTYFLLGDFLAAEALLAELHRRRPKEATFTALLASSQGRRNKLQSALPLAREVLAQRPTDGEAHKLLIVLLVAGGYFDEARARSLEADAFLSDDSEYWIVQLDLALLRHELARAAELVAQIEAKGLTPAQSVAVAGCYERSRRDQEAEQFYTRALAAGFFPAAHLGLARLAIHRADGGSAYPHILAALDHTKPVAEGSLSSADVTRHALGLYLGAHELVHHAEAWIATLPAQTEYGILANHSFFICAPDWGQAEGHLKAVADAIQPNRPLVLKGIYWKRAPKFQQPETSVKPGIHSFWK